METTTSKSSTNIAIKWAAIYAVTVIVLTYLWQILNVDPTSPVKYISYLPFIAFLLLAQQEFKVQLGGFMSYGQGFVAGLLYAVFAGLLIGVFLYIYFSFLDHHAFEKILSAQRDAMQAKTNDSAVVDKTMHFMDNYGIIITALGTMISTPIMGAIVSLIGAAIIKKEPTLADIEQRNTPPATVE
jgi:hypothetical protein